MIFLNSVKPNKDRQAYINVKPTTDKSVFSRIYNETYYYKILVGITLSVRIAFINRRRLTYMALFSRLVCENTGNASTSDMGCCADSDDYSPTNFLGYTIIK
jgi:hypothetical protein